MARTPEGRIEDHLVAECKRHDFVYYKFTAPGKRGVPDRLVIARGHTVFIELKAAGKKPDPLQLYQISEMRRQGGTVYVTDSKEGVSAILNELLIPAPGYVDPQSPTIEPVPWPDDTEINAAIAQADSFAESLFEIAEKYGADVTNNEPRWQGNVFLREVGDFIADVKASAEKHLSSTTPSPRKALRP